MQWPGECSGSVIHHTWSVEGGRVVLGQWNLGPSLPKLAVGLKEERVILSRQGSPLGQDWKVVSLLVLKNISVYLIYYLKSVQMQLFILQNNEPLPTQ